MSEQLIIPNVKLLLESGEDENIFLVSAMCFKDNVQFFYRVVKDKGCIEKEEQTCPICGESVECFGGVSSIDGDIIEVVACLTEAKKTLTLVVDNTIFTQLKSALLLIIERHDFSAYYQVIKLYQSSDLSKLLTKQNWTKKRGLGKPLQTYSVEKTCKPLPDESGMSKSALRSAKSRERRKKVMEDAKKLSETQWRQTIQSSAQALQKLLEKNESMEECQSQSIDQKRYRLSRMGNFKRESKQWRKRLPQLQSTSTNPMSPTANLSRWIKSLSAKSALKAKEPKPRNKLSQQLRRQAVK